MSGVLFPRVKPDRLDEKFPKSSIWREIRNKMVNSKNSIEESSYEHISLNGNNSNESFLSESSDTMNGNLIEK